MKGYPICEVSVGGVNYPKLLGKLSDAPKKLYYRGDLRTLKGRTIAIVGSRRMTRYGREMAEKLVADLVNEDVVTISGFMYGVDTEVHARTVEYGGKTVAVFGCGLDVIYPPENDKLYEQILKKGGLVLSEYSPKAKPHLWKFPQRNRIVAALASLGVLVIEAGEKSGSLITVELGEKMGKKIYALPGMVTSSVSRGTNGLIRDGRAKLVMEIVDILENSRAGRGDRLKLKKGLTELEKEIMESLNLEPLNTDEIAVAVGKSVVEVGSALSLMGIKGLVSESGGKWYLVNS